VKLLDEIEAIQVWHNKIRNYKIELQHPNYVEGDGSIASLYDTVTFFAQHSTNQVSVWKVVFDNEDVRRHPAKIPVLNL
jgi:hypothetical protein